MPFGDPTFYTSDRNRAISRPLQIGVGPKSGDLWAGRLSNMGPRRSARLVDFRTPFSPETPSKTCDGDVGKRAAGI